ncbi:hypothetical protein CA85_34630 [Allorhodopirellula solitaria]|uniref:DUF1294 domain-containing protein n=2 Tax=Allorhodopirellula solitaria TaxID=2527987 RepID=A0A5C5XPH9_9BACT|nr:hypothetical protein CA85_34630 [Allorhodopirellula solitaria]
MRYLPIIVIEMILASALAIVLFWWDKRMATKNGKSQAEPSASSRRAQSPARRSQRISERTLLLVSLVGGWPGAWWASQRFRHKTQKRSFRIRFWIAATIHIAILAAWLSYAA